MQRFEYFIYSLVFLVALLVALRFRKDLKPHVIIPCLVGAIIGPLSEFMYFKDYWRPYTLFGHEVPSIEDVIFGASMIGLTLLVYPLIFKRREWEKHHKRHVQFSLLYLLLAVCLLLILVELLKVNSVIATGTVCLALLVPLLTIRHDLAVPAIASGILMAIFAGVIYYLFFGFIFKNPPWQLWLLNNSHLGIKVFKYIPLTELIWFFTVGSFLEAFDMYVRDARYRHFTTNKSVH